MIHKHPVSIITIENIQKHIPNLYEAVLLSTERARQLEGGHKSLVSAPYPQARPTVMSFYELSLDPSGNKELRNALMLRLCPNTHAASTLEVGDNWDEKELWEMDMMPAAAPTVEPVPELEESFSTVHVTEKEEGPEEEEVV